MNLNNVGDLAKEVEKSMDVKKVASAAVKDGKVDVQGAAKVIKEEVTADEAKNIAEKAMKVVKK